MNKELAPLKDDRYAYNTIHGVETREHNDKLTKQEAEKIKDAVDIFILPIRHGHGLLDDPNALENGYAPGMDDYKYVEDVVSNMFPGDVLFVESVGFDSENDAPHLALKDNVREAVERIYKSPSMGDAEDYETLRNAKDRLNLGKENYRLDVIDYAVRLALLNGIEVVYADMDSYDSNRLDSLIGQNRNAQGMPLDEAEFMIADSIRNKRAVNTVKDYALERIEELAEWKNKGTQKLKYIVLFGADHADDLKDGFDNLGLPSYSFPQAKDNESKRRAEHAEYSNERYVHEQEAHDIETKARRASELVKKKLFMTAKKHALLKAGAYKDSVRNSIGQK